MTIREQHKRQLIVVILQSQTPTLEDVNSAACTEVSLSFLRVPTESVWRTRVIGAQKLLALLVLLGLVLVTFPFSFAASDLVANGGFESGEFDGWSATNSQVLKSTGSVPAHSGKHSARIGTATTPGRVSQTVSIPVKSTARFTAWYWVEKGSTLTVSLNRGDGSEIRKWPATSLSMWTSVTYDLDVSYAGKTVTIEVAGVGYRESVTVMAYCQGFDPVTGQFFSWLCPYTKYNNYYSYVDDISLTSTIALYETRVSIVGLPDQLATKLFVDGKELATQAGSESKVLPPFNVGESHKISVEPYVYKDNATRYYCASETTSVSSDRSITFSYKPEYFLSVSSPYGSTTGSGWYDEGSEASYALDRTTFPIPDFTGALGAKRVFVKWSGDASSSSDDGKITMNGPKSISAIWAVDNTLFYTSIAIIVSGCIAGIAVTYRLVTRRKQPLKLPFKPPIEVPVEELPGGGGVVVSASSPEEQEVLDRLERLQRSREDGTVTEKAYQTLKEDFEKRLAEIRARRPQNS